MSSVSVKNLTKTIRKNIVLNHIDLELDAGKIYGFYGRNGSGKTMLFRALCGLIRPDEGKIVIFDENIGQDHSFPSSLGLVIENVGFWRGMTGIQNLEILASIKNLITTKEIEEAMERVGLGDEKSKKYGAYSLGMRQKLAIAQAIMEKPRLIILDEPTNSLDEEGVNLLANILSEERERGAAILMCSHNKDDLRTMCDQLFYMDHGKCDPLEKERM